jgi:6-phosphogluconolactonase
MEWLDTAVTVPENYKSSTTGDTFDHNQTADIRIHKSGMFLYVSNRGHNSIAVFSLDNQGMMTPVTIVPSGGEIPRAMNFDATGDALYAVNQRTGNIVKFIIDNDTGIPRQAGYEITLPNPVSLQFLALP